MKKIASFTINHDTLMPGMYVSRQDGDITTYDIRVIPPNQPPFMDNDEMHTVEHLFSTFVRNSKFEEKIIYFGPMGCRTGFYFLVRDMDKSDAIALASQAFSFVRDYEGVIPGSSKVECGNYLEHNLEKAKIIGEKMFGVLENYPVERLIYP